MSQLGANSSVINSTVERLHQNFSEMESKVENLQAQMNNYQQKAEDGMQGMVTNVDGAFRKAWEVQKSNEELQKSNTHLMNQLSFTQQQLSDVQTSNEHLKNQLSLTQQQLLDVQKNNDLLQEKLLNQLSLTQQQLSNVQTSNEHLKNQLSLTQQQLLGVQSMMTCSRLWVVSHDQFTIGEEIGRGSWASVHKATFRGTNVAAKRLHDKITFPETREVFQQEMEMALLCQHQNIVTFLGATLEGHPVILMELMDINLRSAYEQNIVKDHHKVGVFGDIASALHFLHTRPDPVIHRDVSSANVLLKACTKERWFAKLGDLGTAKVQQETTTPGPGAIAYAAPEVASPDKRSCKMDVYNFGILILETLIETHPFNKVGVLKSSVQQQFPHYHHLVVNCTNQHSNNRPTVYDIIRELDKIKAAKP